MKANYDTGGKKNTCESYEPWKLSHSKTRFNKRLENNDPSA